MNYYNPYTGSRNKKRVRRILAVLLSAVIITGGTVIFGNYLKDKADSSQSGDYIGIGREDLSADTESPVIIPPSEGGTGSSESVRGLCVPLGSAADFGADVTGDGTDGGVPAGESFEERLAEAAAGLSGVMIPLTDDEGYLLYNSVRAGESSRLPANPAIPDTEDLSAAVASAKSKGLRVSGLIRSAVSLAGTDDEVDSAIAAEQRIAADAAEAGFDEIIIMSLVASPEDINGETSHVILRYLNQMTAVAENTEVGLALPPDVYNVATLSPQIELLASRSVFLAMELNAEHSTAEYLNYICENLAGTLSVYNMRMLLAPADTDIGNAMTEKLTAVGHENYLYTCVPADPPPAADTEPDTTDAPDDAATPDDTEETDGIE